MSTWVWILIAIAAVLIVVAVLALGGKRAQGRRVEKKRDEAQELRSEAERRLATAGQREAVAGQAAERATRERGAAEEAIRRAEEVDPDVPDAPNDERGVGRDG